MRRIVPALLLGLLLGTVPAVARDAATSDLFRAPRPVGGEWFGVYLVDKKVGTMFTSVERVPGHPELARAVEELVLKVQTGQNLVQRRHREVRTYESKSQGRLVGFSIEDQGDGGNQTLVGRASPTGMEVTRRRPGQPDEALHLPPSRETVEDADQVRVALVRGEPISGMLLDGTDLSQYRVSTTPGEQRIRNVNGVQVRLRTATTVSEKEKVPLQATVAQDGAVVEMAYGSAMVARAEPKAVAQRLDKVEIFGLTRLVLPHSLGPAARAIPGQVTFVVTGFPERFHRLTDRQSYRTLEGGRTEVTIRAAPPDPAGLKPRPLNAPGGADYLGSSILVESDNPRIVAKAKEIAGGERDAYASARKVVVWVGEHMRKDYGASADRATDVLRQMRGDCTEHSLLSVALLRALGIPARRVDGVVYVQNEDGVPALYWHEWVEAWVGSAWTQLDPTFGQPVADATHLALGEESNAEIMPLLGQLKVVDAR